MGEVLGTPILVYNRIHANRRKTRLLLSVFALALLPVIATASTFLVAWIHVWYLSASPTVLAFYQAQWHAVQPVNGTVGLREIPTPVMWLYAGENLLGMAIVALPLVAATTLLTSRYRSRVLQRAGARPLEPGEEPDLVHLIENLCIGAGLPLPRIHVIESPAPNAFATGDGPDDASLVVTRGLIELLDRRELEGVIAHELSHIGNHDIALSTTLAAVIATLSLPLKALSSPFRFAFRQKGGLGVVAMIVVLKLAVPYQFEMLFSWLFFYLPLLALRSTDLLPAYYWWWFLYCAISPVYLVFVAPVVPLLVRQAVSRQREFLADADAALLTRSPEGLALALVKIAAVRGEPLTVGESAVHLYFVDPLSRGSRLLHILFPSHPSLEKRIELLARMGNGIAASTMQAAREAATRVTFTKSDPEEVHAPRDETASSPRSSDLTGFDGFIRLYDRPVDGSRLLALLPQDAVVKLEDVQGDFVGVITPDGMAGYVLRSALRMQPAEAAPLAGLKNLRD